MNKKIFIVGIDEVGRGPLAGPLVLSCVYFEKRHEKKILRKYFEGKIRDSKKLKEKDREEIAKIFSEDEMVYSKTIFVKPQTIDKKGLSFCLRDTVSKLLKNLEGDLAVELDGSLFAPDIYIQETIIKGDEKKVSIALASIISKVKRDNYMKRISKKYPKYGFEIHKGYGTKKHREIIKNRGICEVHRRSFLS